ncbi:conserved hypothetical protein [Histoplasma capsulatum H143]|uniref:Uncharacterized protein n=1 Tax=Ajellomyces capsulatus (strain H143) TaxID=544712 RepID=C6HBU7_AJECH|nr:conserved hypothetical protein [Histoplasma capsulatum H143]
MPKDHHPPIKLQPLIKNLRILNMITGGRTSPPASPDVLQQPTESPTVTLDGVESPQMPSALNVGGGEKRLSLAQYDRPAPGNVSPSSPENVSLGVNDRLRDEIMRSLTPRASIDSQEQAHAGGGSNPSLEAGPDNPSSEGLGTAASPSNLPPQTPDMQSTPVAPSFPGLGSEHNSDVSGQKEPAKTLKKRFSWEESSVEDNTQGPQEHQQLTIDPATASDMIQPSLEEKTLTGPVPVSRGHDEQDPERSASTTYSQAALTLSPTRTEVIPSQNVAEHETKSVQPPDSLLLQPAPAASSPSTLVHPQPASHPPATQDPKLLGFRQIMAIEKPGDKIKTFERTRKQFADMDTGLSSWIKATASSNPDHEDLAQRNGRLPPGTTFTHRPSTSRNKFPKLTSLGPLSLPTSHHEGSPMTTPTSASGNTRHGSNANQFATKINTQQVQAKGKDLLHTAGVLGGKAGGAAKGLFAKGRSKFRNSNSTDKGFYFDLFFEFRAWQGLLSTLCFRVLRAQFEHVNHSRPAFSSRHRSSSTPSLDAQQQAGLYNGQQTAAAAADAAGKPLPRLLSLKLDRESFSNDMTVTWEEHETMTTTSASVSSEPQTMVTLGGITNTIRDGTSSMVLEPARKTDRNSCPGTLESPAGSPVDAQPVMLNGFWGGNVREQVQLQMQDPQPQPQPQPQPVRVSHVDLITEVTVSAGDVGFERPVKVQEEVTVRGAANEEVKDENKAEAKEEAKEKTNDEARVRVEEQVDERVEDKTKEVHESINEALRQEPPQEPQEPQRELQEPEEPQEEPQQEAPEQKPQQGAPDQLQPQARPKLQPVVQPELQDEIQSPTESVEERPTSSAALSMIDNRASIMPSDYATYTSPPVEEARAVKVIGRKASIITSELRTFISREITIGKKGKMSPTPASESVLDAEGSSQPPLPPSGNENERGQVPSNASRVRMSTKSTPEAILSNGLLNDINTSRYSQPSQPQQTVSAQQVEGYIHRSDAASSSRRESTEPRYVGVDKAAQRVSAEPKSPPSTPAIKTKSLPSLPPEDKPITDLPDDYNPIDKTRQEAGNQHAEQIQSQSKPVTVESTYVNNIATEKPHLPPPVPDTTAQRERAERQSSSGIPEGKPADQPSIKPFAPRQAPSIRPTSPPRIPSAQFAAPVKEGRSSTQLIRDYFSPSGNSSSRPPTVQEETRPGSAMANLMSKVTFSRQTTDRRSSASGQPNEKSWSNRFQSFKVDSGLSKTRTASTIESEEAQRAASLSMPNPNDPSITSPSNQSPASKMKIHGKFIRGANRLAQNAGNMKKKNMPKVAGLFNRHSRQAEPTTQTPHTPEYSPHLYETQVAALPQQKQPYSSTYPSRYSNSMPHDYQQQQTRQPQTQPVTQPGGRRSMTSQHYAQDNVQPSRNSQHTNLPPHTTVLAHATPPGNPQSYSNNAQLPSHSPMSFIQFQNGHVPAQRAARTQSPDPAQHPLADVATKFAAGSPPPEGPSFPNKIPQNRNYNNHTPSQHMAGSGKHIEPVELPVPVPGDDSSEEIVMSSTAYPGQEWHPEFYLEED